MPRWMTRFALVLAVTGCQSQINPAFCPNHQNDPRCLDGGLPSDTGDAVGGIPPDARTCFGAGAYVVCLDTLPSNTITINSTIDTSPTSAQCLSTQPANWLANGQSAACFVVAKTITVSSQNTISARGPRPLVILATDALTVNASLSVAAARDQPTTIP